MNGWFKHSTNGPYGDPRRRPAPYLYRWSSGIIRSMNAPTVKHPRALQILGKLSGRYATSSTLQGMAALAIAD